MPGCLIGLTFLGTPMAEWQNATNGTARGLDGRLFSSLCCPRADCPTDSSAARGLHAGPLGYAARGLMPGILIHCPRAGCRAFWRTARGLNARLLICCPRAECRAFWFADQGLNARLCSQSGTTGWGAKEGASRQANYWMGAPPCNRYSQPRGGILWGDRGWVWVSQWSGRGFHWLHPNTPPAHFTQR